MVRTIFSLVVAAALAVIGLPWCFLVLRHVWLTHLTHAREPFPIDPLATAAGVLIGLALVCWKRPNWFLHTAIHECCHLLMCALLWVRVDSFRASRGGGGEVTHARPDAIRETLIAIAPYTVPLVLVPCLLAERLTAEGSAWHALASALTGFAYVHHVQGLFHNVRLNFFGRDSDLVKVGRPLSLVLIAGTLMLVTAWTITLLWW